MRPRALVFLVAALACGPGGGGDGPAPPDGGAPRDAQTTTDARPFAAPADTWTWMPVPGMACGNGSATGVGVNLRPGATKLFVFLQGGGACWDAFTCFVVRSAAHLDGYGAAQLAGDVRALAGGLLDRTNAGSAFKDASFVFVPYCTGDLHGGQRVASYAPGNPAFDVHHVGRRNLETLLPLLKATVPGATTVWVAGSSAGGYGTLLNLERIAVAFAGAEVHALADCSPPVTPEGTRWAAWQREWPLEFPAGCAGCSARFPAVLDDLAVRLPRSRIGLLAFEDDAVVSLFFGYGPGQMKQALTTLLAAPRASVRAFVRPGAEHVMLDRYDQVVGAGGVRLADWVQRWARGDLGWANVGVSP
jgi:hypothetical protein